jgi:hypothetical protein
MDDRMDGWKDEKSFTTSFTICNDVVHGWMMGQMMGRMNGWKKLHNVLYYI